MEQIHPLSKDKFHLYTSNRDQSWQYLHTEVKYGIILRGKL